MRKISILQYKVSCCCCLLLFCHRPWAESSELAIIYWKKLKKKMYNWYFPYRSLVLSYTMTFFYNIRDHDIQILPLGLWGDYGWYEFNNFAAWLSWNSPIYNSTNNNTFTASTTINNNTATTNNNTTTTNNNAKNNDNNINHYNISLWPLPFNKYLASRKRCSWVSTHLLLPGIFF